MTQSDKIVSYQEITSKGGKARAQKLSPERRKEIAILASNSRKCIEKTPKATHIGELSIGNIKISCAVLEDGTALISQKSIYETLGKAKSGTSQGKKPKAIVALEQEIGGQMPSFLAVSNLIPFMSNELKSGGVQVEYIHPKIGKSRGFKCQIIPEICTAYSKALRAGVLTKDQIPLAERCQIINEGLALVGITGMIYECTGYEKIKENNELQLLFEKFIAKELLPWTKKFPNAFFENIKRMYGLEHLKGNPKFCGHLINRFIYNEISPDVLEELKRINPVQESGIRKHCHHQLLTDDVGHPALEKQIIKINTIMSASDNKEDFEKLFNKIKEKEAR